MKNLKQITEFTEYKIPKGVAVEITPFVKGDENRWWRTLENLDKMMKDGRPVTLVSPVRSLSEEDLEEYRKFFCQYAKQHKRNYIYLDVPFKVEYVDK